MTLNPLQAAIDRTQRKTQILSVATERVISKGGPEIEALIEILKTSVDPDTSGSVVEYHKLLVVPPDLSESDTMNGTLQSTTSTAMTTGDSTHENSMDEALLHRALIVALEDHARCIEAALALPLLNPSTKSQLRTFFQSLFALELHNMYPAGDWQKRSAAWIDPPREPVVPKEERAIGEVSVEAEKMEPQRKQSTGRRLSLRKRLSFLSLGGKSTA